MFSERIMVTDTLRGTKEVFEPISPPDVKMYVCGPTVYDEPHLGHAKTAVFFDVVRRYLAWAGYSIFYVTNVTDIDDKIIARAAREGVDWKEVARRYEEEYFRAMQDLKVIAATANPRATEYIDKILELISSLVKSGYAYVTPDGVYFSVETFEGYGKLSKVKLDSLVRDARVKTSEKKKHPADFALWKFSKPGEPRWPASWGDGRPGWHIECSAMIYALLGEQIDIHGGGSDLIFPHHENEIAQSEAFTGKSPFVRYWMHVGLLNVKGEKMAKSLKNYFSVKAALRRYDPDVLRIFLTSAHYRKPLEFSENALKSTENRVLFWKEAAAKAARYSLEGRKGELNESEMEVRREMHLETKKFFSALSDDFNTPVAYASLDALASMASRIVSEGLSPNLASEVVYLMDRTSSLLGIDVLPRYQRRDSLPYIETLIEVRKELRKRRMYDISDAIRAKLKDLGVAVEDKNGDSIWWFEE